MDQLPRDARFQAAIAALNGMLAADGNDPRWTGRDPSPEYQRGGGKWIDPIGVAQQAVEIADALISVLEQ